MSPLRPARSEDVPALTALIARSARTLSAGYYSPEQIEAAVRYVFGVDSQLIADGTYFVVLAEDQLAGCGGWSFRRNLYGGDQRPMGTQATLDPTTEAARIRAFFVAPEYARQGVGRRLLAACTVAARAAGFTRLTLMATLPGVPLYTAAGFQPVGTVFDTLPNGVILELVHMECPIP